jgi:PAP2 superfamily
MNLNMTTRLFRVLTVLFAMTAFWACNPKTGTVDSIAPVSKATSEFSAQLPQAWMDMGYATVRRQGMFALDASRTYAYMAITAYESMVHGISGGRSLAGQLKGLNYLPRPDADRVYDWGIVLCHAMPKVMRAMIPNLSPESRLRIDVLANGQEEQLLRSSAIPADVMNNSKNYATLLADAIIVWANTDNRIGMESLPYTAPSREGNLQYWWGPTLGQTYMMPFWWTSRPFVISTYTLCEPEAPLPYSENPTSAYYLEVKEAYDASFDPAKVAIGNYWANNPSQSGSPAGSWLAISTQLVDQYRLDIIPTLRMYVLMAVGTRDAFIAAWYTKYKYNLQRPVTYIREVMGHRNWNSPVPTPPYPDYVSGTSINAGVSSETLSRLFGANRAFTDSQHSDKGFGTRRFNSFREAAIEAFHSRIYGGVHMRRACEKGYEQGRCIANAVNESLRFE